MTESKLTISWEKEGHIFCDFRFSSSFQKIDMILLTRPEGGLIGLIIFISILLTDPHSAFFQKVNFSIEKSADQIYFFPN